MSPLGDIFIEKEGLVEYIHTLYEPCHEQTCFQGSLTSEDIKKSVCLVSMKGTIIISFMSRHGSIESSCQQQRL